MHHPRIINQAMEEEREKREECPQVTGQWRHHDTLPIELTDTQRSADDGIIQTKLWD